MSTWARVRRNHALEHATVAVMVQRRGRRVPLIGMSVPGGFVLAGAFTPEEVLEGAPEALRRLQNGEHYLAVSDDCGTTLLAGGILTTVAAIALTRGRVLARFWMAVTAAMAINRFSPLIGRSLQRAVTTDARVERCEIQGIWTGRLSRRVAIARVSVGDGD
jgi:hypothetical protein